MSRFYVVLPCGGFVCVLCVSVCFFSSQHEPLCEQKVVKRSKLTHVCFNKQVRHLSKDDLLSIRFTLCPAGGDATSRDFSGL